MDNRFIVNVCVALRRGGQWMLIVRHPDLPHAGGTLSVPGGKVEGEGLGSDVLEETARREVAEEVGVDLKGTGLRYAESGFFVSDTGQRVVNVVFAAELPEGAAPCPAAPLEVSEVRWLSAEEARAQCPPWTVRHIERAEAVLAD
jgi:8-oxo-dGTP diphosphatase